MNNEQHSAVSALVIKIVTAWLAAVGIANWSDLAAALAALYTFLLTLEWVWKKFGRPCAESRGWIKHRARRHYDLKEKP